MGLGKTYVWELTKLIMPLGLDFMPPDQIVNMSLNGLRRRVATHHKTLTEPQMDEPLLHWTPDTRLQLGVPLHYHSISQKNHLLEDLQN
jgi:hypothetical protein